MPYEDPIPELKRRFARVICEEMDGWSQEMAGALLRMDQPGMSHLRAGRLDRFSLERLVRFVARVQGEVTFTVTWKQRRWNNTRTV
jgi:predicted XRE-type DNA-binding protein